MDTSSLVAAEFAGDLEIITHLTEVAILDETIAAGVRSVFVVRRARGGRAGFDADVIVRNGNGRVRAVAVITVLLDAPGDQVGSVRRDVLMEKLDLAGAYAELSGFETYAGFEARPFSWTEGLYRHAVRRRFARHRLMATLQAVATQVRRRGER